ncbi:lysophospholipid acyltransferase family protein [Adhaeretor mobilis]|uniref:Acyltransferase n=1 Tax=Adhaeretor mobilis TaxID=1930276 RepID=A0A517MYQ9_9BACT|nr:1-acyl-sn-glycerol-3-phosphate acyltransferase [Adhaeretor mobilis]QDT00026.1 Acyltransferase [Adhaeretor mobilis]
MQRVVIDEPYEFVPPVKAEWWPTLIQYYLTRHLRKAYGIHEVEVRDAEKLRASVEAGHGIIISPNHCRMSDPLTMGMLSREIDRHLYSMASWHLFKQSWLAQFVMRRMGGFSVYREGVDRQAIDQAVEVLIEGRRPLVIFPEGAISRHNDRLMPLIGGVSFIARTAAKRREKAGVDGGVVIHPIGIRYFFQGNLEESVKPVLDEIESHFSWFSQTEKPLVERIRQIGQALLSLKEIEYFGWARTGDFYERVDKLIHDMLEKLEQRWGIKHGEEDSSEESIVARVKALRSTILPGLIENNLNEEERQDRWRQLAACYYVQQMSHYPRNYVRMSEKNIQEHILETVERFEEDFTDKVRIHGPLKVVLQVGDPIEVASRRDRSAEGDPVMDNLRGQLQSMVSKLSEEAVRV